MTLIHSKLSRNKALILAVLLSLALHFLISQIKSHTEQQVHTVGVVSVNVTLSSEASVEVSAAMPASQKPKTKDPLPKDEIIEKSKNIVAEVGESMDKTPDAKGKTTSNQKTHAVNESNQIDNATAVSKLVSSSSNTLSDVSSSKEFSQASADLAVPDDNEGQLGVKKASKQDAKNEESASKESAQVQQTEVLPKPNFVMGSADNPEPQYPSIAYRRGWQGTVVIGVNVDDRGIVESLLIIESSHYGVLDYAAYETIRDKWKFSPVIVSGKPVSSYVEVPVSFTIR